MTLPQFKYEIPRRSDVCSAHLGPFVEGEEITSLLFPKGERYERKDICSSCAAEALKCEGDSKDYIYWKSLLLRKESGKKFTKDEKAIELLKEKVSVLTSDSSREELGFVYVLALYLERRKQLIKMQTSRKSRIEAVYESVDNGETFLFQKINLSTEEYASLQEALISQLSFE